MLPCDLIFLADRIIKYREPNDVYREREYNIFPWNNRRGGFQFHYLSFYNVWILIFTVIFAKRKQNVASLLILHCSLYWSVGSCRSEFTAKEFKMMKLQSTSVLLHLNDLCWNLMEPYTFAWKIRPRLQALWILDDCRMQQQIKMAGPLWLYVSRMFDLTFCWK